MSPGIALRYDINLSCIDSISCKLSIVEENWFVPSGSSPLWQWDSTRWQAGLGRRHSYPHLTSWCPCWTGTSRTRKQRNRRKGQDGSSYSVCEYRPSLGSLTGYCYGVRLMSKLLYSELLSLFKTAVIDMHRCCEWVNKPKPSTRHTNTIEQYNVVALMSKHLICINHSWLYFYLTRI